MSEVPDMNELYVGGIHPTDMTSAEAAEEIARKQREFTKGIIEAERRSIECVNALAGLNPSALAGLIEAAESCAKHAKPERGEITLHATDWFALMDALANLRGDA